MKSEEPSSSITHPSAATPTQPAATPTPGSRVLASPYARALAAEKGINLSAVGSGTGYSGSITSRDLTSVPSQQTPFTDIELTGMRKVSEGEERDGGGRGGGGGGGDTKD